MSSPVARAFDCAALASHSGPRGEGPGLDIWLLIRQPVSVLRFVDRGDGSSDVDGFAEQLDVDGRLRWHPTRDGERLSEGR